LSNKVFGYKYAANEDVLTHRGGGRHGLQCLVASQPSVAQSV